MKLSGKYFCGHEISQYGQEHGYLDYRTLSQAFQHVLANEIIGAIEGAGLGWFEPLTDVPENEVWQWYIVDENGAEILQKAGEYVVYNEEVNIYLWGVTHWGTSWDHVLTDIPCNTGEIE